VLGSAHMGRGQYTWGGVQQVGVKEACSIIPQKQRQLHHGVVA
jgi:hypothetical protein